MIATSVCLVVFLGTVSATLTFRFVWHTCVPLVRKEPSYRVASKPGVLYTGITERCDAEASVRFWKLRRSPDVFSGITVNTVCDGEIGHCVFLQGLLSEISAEFRLVAPPSSSISCFRPNGEARDTERRRLSVDFWDVTKKWCPKRRCYQKRWLYWNAS